MSESRKLNVALVGLAFGMEFAPIYRLHPDVGRLTVCDIDPALLKKVGDRFDIEDQRTSLDDVLRDPTIDAVHLVTPVTDHAELSVRVLEASKHCATTIPMGLSNQELVDVIAAKRASGKKYMMMETAVYSREFLFVQDLVRSGAFGDISFARGAHLQDMSGWPDYWQGFPPLAHITHAISPALALLGTRAVSVNALGSGRLSEAMSERYGNPFPVETAVFATERADVAIEVTRSMFKTARPYTESFALYGERLGFEWQHLEEELPYLYEMSEDTSKRRRPITVTRPQAPDRQDLLPDPIRPFTQQSVFNGEITDHLSFVQGGGHGGSHPHLVHEFVRSILDDRTPTIDEIVAADWSAAGIAAHQSALLGGARVDIPSFSA